jgi:uncharacterized membrane protein
VTAHWSCPSTRTDKITSSAGDIGHLRLRCQPWLGTGANQVIESNTFGRAVTDSSLCKVIAYSAEDAQCSVVGCVVTGPERTFDQDPALAIRVLADIALRALSPAVNDPTSAAQALDAIQACLERLAARDLDVASVTGVQGHERPRLVLPSWDEYVALAFDELLVAGPSALQVARRLVVVLGELADAIPSARRAPIKRRLERATEDLQQAFPDEAQATP